jgi:hypothetical protein
MACADTGAGGLCIPGVNPSCAPEPDGGSHSSPDVTGAGETGAPGEGSSGCVASQGGRGLSGVLIAMMIGFFMIFFGKRREDSEGP